MLDSGAFTFLNGKSGKVDWRRYVDDYARFINQNNIRNFIELDIDSVVGVDNVRVLRRRLEDQTKAKSIPVWHKKRGYDDFLRTVQEYDYAAIGGIVTKEIKKTEYQYFRELLRIARANNCKIHGLGFTAVNELSKYRFDSVDSITWKTGGMYGSVYQFENGTLKTYRSREKRVKDYKAVDAYNLEQWKMFQQYADKYL